MASMRSAKLDALIVTTVLILSAISAPVVSQRAIAAKEVDPPQLRLRWQEFVSGPEGAKRLASLEAAVKKMRSLDSSPLDSADYRRSWQYWANIHGYYGAQSRDGTVEAHVKLLKDNGLASYVKYYQGIIDELPPDSTAKAVWATCQHSGNSQALNFFGWHRMYLYYFERVLRWAATDDTLRLPYWDYTDPGHVALPAEFRSTASTLYDSRRDPGINTGAATLNALSTNVNTLLGDTSYFSYEYQIENTIHGYVHCTVGPTCPIAHMGDVPVAANDAIFYSHHANIDRLWACWQNLHPTPGGTWQDEQFNFVDENGVMQTQPVKNFLDSRSLGYDYDNIRNCTRGGTTAGESQTSSGPQTSTTIFSTTKSLLIDHPRTTVDIDVPRDLFAQTESKAKMELVLINVTAKSPPGVLFDVYLTNKAEPPIRKFAGTISWFGVFNHRGDEGPVRRTLRFEVTAQLRELVKGANNLGLAVTIEATQGRVPTDPSKAQSMQAAAEKAFNTQSKVQIGAIELRRLNFPPVPENR
jgi:hypothetical protein